MSNVAYTPQRAMVIVAHPDDIEFSCAGTVARWVKEGAAVSYVLVTSGDVGIADLSLSREEAMAIREKEQQAAADAIGVQEVIFCASVMAWSRTPWNCANGWCARSGASNPKRWWSSIRRSCGRGGIY
ncbi:MAG: PIG-L family deacetylase [Caldilineaceae bacterium]